MQTSASIQKVLRAICFLSTVESPGNSLHTSSFLSKAKMFFYYRCAEQILNSVLGDLYSAQTF